MEEKNVSATQGSTTEDLLQALNEVKANSVPKAEYDKIKEDNRILLNNIVNGTPINSTAVEESGPSVSELKDKLGRAHNDLEYAETFLKLREAVIKETGKDPTANYATDNLDYELEQAELVANTMRECIELANGNPEVYKAQLMSRVVDTPLLPRKRR